MVWIPFLMWVNTEYSNDLTHGDPKFVKASNLLTLFLANRAGCYIKQNADCDKQRSPSEDRSVIRHDHRAAACTKLLSSPLLSMLCMLHDWSCDAYWSLSSVHLQFCTLDAAHVMCAVWLCSLPRTLLTSFFYKHIHVGLTSLASIKLGRPLISIAL